MDFRTLLTRREYQVVREVVAGARNKDIGKKFEISEETVKRHLSNIFDKAGCSTRTELVVMYLSHSATLSGYACSRCDRDVLIRTPAHEPSGVEIHVADLDLAVLWPKLCPECMNLVMASVHQLTANAVLPAKAA